MCISVIQGDCRTGGSAESEKEGKVAEVGSSGGDGDRSAGPVEPFSTVYPFPRGA